MLWRGCEMDRTRFGSPPDKLHRRLYIEYRTGFQLRECDTSNGAIQIVAVLVSLRSELSVGVGVAKS